jgi:hypothetical protein
MLHEYELQSNIIISQPARDVTPTNVYTSVRSVEDRDVALDATPVITRGPRGRINTFVFVDNGSNSTLISEGLLQAIGLTGSPSILQLSTFQGHSTFASKLVQFDLVSLDTNKVIHVDRA